MFEKRKIIKRITTAPIHKREYNKVFACAKMKRMK